MSDISSIKDASESTNFKTEICLILIILMLSGKSNLYMTGPRTLIILKGSSLAKFNLLLGLVI